MKSIQVSAAVKKLLKSFAYFSTGLSILFHFINVYLFLRRCERQSEAAEGQTQGEQNLKQAPGSELSAQSPLQGSNSRIVRS